MLAIFFISVGIICIAFYFLSFKVPLNHALVSRRARNGRYLEGWNFGLKPTGRTLVPLQKSTLSFGAKDQLIELHTPDDGLLGVSVSVSFSPDESDGESLSTYINAIGGLEKTLEARVQSALIGWISRKPLPGTLKRAQTMKDDAENFVRAKLASVSETALILYDDPSFYLEGGYRVKDLGIRVHEVHITDIRNLRSGTGKADWGDGEEVIFNAQNCCGRNDYLHI